MSHFVTGMSEDLEKECHTAMLHDNIVTSMLMVHAQQVEEIHLRKRKREPKMAKSFDRDSSKSSLDVQVKQKFNKRLSNKVTSNFSNNNNDRGSNPKPEKWRNVYTPKERQTCGKCGKKIMCELLVRTNSCYS